MIRSNTKVTFQKSKGLFKKCVGSYVHTDGEPRAQIFWLTGNRAESQALADIVLDFYQQDVIDRGAKHWTPELITQVKASLKRYRTRLVEQHARAADTMARLSATTPQ